MEYDKTYRLLHKIQQTYSNLFLVSNKIQMVSDKYCEPFTSRQYMAMLAILHLPEDETSYINIAQKMGTTKQNVTQIIKSLEKKKYVYIEDSKKDKRSVNVVISPMGKQAMIECGEDGSIHLMADLFKNFTEDEIDVLQKLLGKLYAFDGVSVDGYEEEINMTEINRDSVCKALDRFEKLRNTKNKK